MAFLSRLQDGKLCVPSLAEMKTYNIVVATLSTARTLALMEMPRGHFSHIFIDEAAQVSVGWTASGCVCVVNH